MKSFYILFTGCPRRQLDCERIKNYLIANNIKWEESPEEADYIFVSTCGVSKYFEDYSIEKILEAGEYNGEIIVYGCLPAMNMKRINEVFNGKTIKTVEIDKIDKLFPDFQIKFYDIPDANKAYVPAKVPTIETYKQKSKRFDQFHFLRYLNMLSAVGDKIATSAYKKFPYLFFKDISIGNSRFIIDCNNEHYTIRISEGCVGNCRFCTIKKAIGRLKSKPVPLILEELKKGIFDKQYKLNIVSSDTGSYGLDIGSNLPQLLHTILKENRHISIGFIQDMHPYWICRYKRELIELVETKRIKSILTAVQSGSQRILKQMNRYTDMQDFKDVVKQLRKVHPRLRLRTQVIVGFPSETAEDLQETIKLIKECEFNEVDIFHYHETPFMDSVNIQPKVPENVIEDYIKSLCMSLPITTSRHVCKSVI